MARCPFGSALPGSGSLVLSKLRLRRYSTRDMGNSALFSQMLADSNDGGSDRRHSSTKFLGGHAQRGGPVLQLVIFVDVDAIPVRRPVFCLSSLMESPRVVGREVTVPAGAWARGDAIVKPWRRPGGTGANPQWRIPHREGHAHGSRGPSHAAFTWHLPDRNREDPTLIAPLTAEPSMAIKTAEDLFIHELSDIYSAEKQLTKALPRLARAAENPDLATAFETHLEETQGQIERIDQVVEILGIRLKRIKCAAMEGLVEGKEVIDSIDKGPVRDAALIGGAQKVEHYEIASYGTIAALAKQLGYKDALPLLLETLEEEKATDEKLTLLAKGGGNATAAQAPDRRALNPAATDGGLSARRAPDHWGRRTCAAAWSPCRAC